VAISVGRIQTIRFCQKYCLNDGESFLPPVFQIPVCFLAVEPMEKLPGGIAEIKKGCSVLVYEKSPVLGYLEPAMIKINGWTNTGSFGINYTAKKYKKAKPTKTCKHNAAVCLVIHSAPPVFDL
jgi:hypothetical protein